MSFRKVLLLTVTLIWGVTAESDICFEKIGCLSMSYPWSSILRQVPAPLPPEELPIRLQFFSRESRQGIRTVTFPDLNLHRAPLKISRPTIIITHDHEDDGTKPWLHALKEAYLRNVDVNVIIMDWSSGSRGFDAAQAAGNIRVVAKVMSRFLRELSEKVGLSPKDVHLIGDGMGAHLMAYIANEFQTTGRITGLDPTRDYFEFHDHRVRLDASDADFVDIIHTNAKIFPPRAGKGVRFPNGHVDFYVNGGEQQPGCLPFRNTFPQIKNLGQISELPKKYVDMEEGCNHRRAREYFVEAVKNKGNCVILGQLVTLPELTRNLFNRLTDGHLAPLTTRICFDFDCVPMGMDTARYPARGLFLVTTKRSQPYCVPNPTVSAIKYAERFEHMLSSFRERVPFLHAVIPEVKEGKSLP